MKFTPRVSATAALSAVLLLAASPGSAQGAVIDPGTPLDGVDPGGAVAVLTIAAPIGGSPYSAFPFVGAGTAAPGDIVILKQVTGNSTVDDAPANWEAVARFFSPSDPDGSKGTDATEAIGFFGEGTFSPATDFSTFKLFPNVLYIPEQNALGGPNPEVNASFSEFGPAGVIPANQSAIINLIVFAPEPASIGLLGIGGALLLTRRRRPQNVFVSVA